MSCEHPDCFAPIHSICTNHCHWSLCQEHLDKHQNSLLLEFEQVLKDLIQPTNELSKSLDEIKQKVAEDREKELQSLQQVYQKQINHLEQQVTELNKYQNQFNQISEHLIQIKNKEKILSQNDFQQMDNLSKEMIQYQNFFKNFNPVPLLSAIANQCPLTSLNIFGLLSSHHVRLCSSHRKLRNLYEHFRNYHHLTEDYANQLIEAIRLRRDPIETKIFPPDTQVIALEDKQVCPFYNSTIVNGIHSKSCSTMITNKLLPIHLKTVHRLRSSQIKEVLQTN